MTSRLAALPQGNRSHPQLRASIERSWPRGRLHRWATAGEVMRGSVVRGRARGSYRLQKSTGGAWPFTPEGEELSDHDEMGLALPRESVGEVKERRKPDRRWQNRETGGGFPQTSRVAQASRFGNTCRGKALRIGKVVPFDEGAAEAVLVPRKCPGSSTPEGYGARQGASEVGRQPRAWPKKPRRGGTARGGARIHQAERRGEPCTDRPKLEACRQARAQPGSDCRKAVWRRTEEPDPSARGRRGSILRSVQRKLRARKSNGLRVLVSTVGCRGRREASSPRHRGEPRGKPRLHGVARCGDGSRRDALTRIGRKGCEDFRANVTGNAEGFARSQDRDRTDGRHPGLMGGVAFNRVASSGVLATWGASTPDERREPERRTRERRSRGSTHGATEGVRGCDVR